MYFWNTAALAKKLRLRSLSQSEKMKYFVASSACYVLFFEINGYLNESPDFWPILRSAVTVMTTIIGIIFCYRANSEGDGQEFIDRFICLSWPIAIKVVVGMSLAYIAYLGGGTAIWGDRFERFNESTTYVDMAFSLFFEVVFYWRVAYHLRWVARPPEIEQ
jgi:hypothetical protein